MGWADRKSRDALSRWFSWNVSKKRNMCGRDCKENWGNVRCRVTTSLVPCLSRRHSVFGVCLLEYIL